MTDGWSARSTTDDASSARDGLPLAGVRVLDFSTLLPGPLASLLLAEAGADVVKIESPGKGDEMRGYVPKLGRDSANFALLNRGKRSIAADLKDPRQQRAVLDLAADADVVLEQSRPGVMDRLGLGFEQVKQRNQDIVYCSITGYGQRGPDAHRAGHDLNYLAQAGVLGLSTDSTGRPPLPPTVLADIAGGTYPAVINILLALMRSRTGGGGCHLDVSMTANVYPLAYGMLAQHAADGTWPEPGAALLTGGSPRYQIYSTSDGGFLAVAALEEKFWRRFCELAEVDDAIRGYDESDSRQSARARDAVASRIAEHTAEHWTEMFGDEDVCCCVVADAEQAYARLREDPEYERYRVTGQRDDADDFDVPALPTPLDPVLRRSPGAVSRPLLGADDDLLS